MSRFYGKVEGSSRTAATRRGHGALTTYAAGWSGAIRVELFDLNGKDHYAVSLVPWESSGGKIHLLAEGELRA